MTTALAGLAAMPVGSGLTWFETQPDNARGNAIRNDSLEKAALIGSRSGAARQSGMEAVTIERESSRPNISAINDGTATVRLRMAGELPEK